jgi:hypothetical protein
MQRTDSYTESERVMCVAEIYSLPFREANPHKNPKRFRGSLKRDTFGTATFGYRTNTSVGNVFPLTTRCTLEVSPLIPVVA